MGTAQFGFYLRNYREKIGYGLREFAMEVGVSPSTLSAIELGQRKITASFDLNKAAELLGIKPGSSDWNEFFDLSRQNTAPSDVLELLSNQEYSPQLISLLRTVDRVRPSAEVLNSLHEYLHTFLKEKLP